MQKKLLTLAVAAALAAPAAMADVTVYGQMHYSLDWVDGGNQSLQLDADGNVIEDANGNDLQENSSVSEFNTGVSRETRIGFKGAEDLGGGLKGIWQIETKVDNLNDKLAFRNTFVGLSGGWGTVLAGRHDTPYKLATTKLDFFVDRAADYNNLIGTINGQTIFDERVPQTIAYVSPNWSGFSFAGAWVDHYFDDEENSSSGDLFDVEDENDSAYSLMAMYDNAGFFASVAYELQQGKNVMGVTGLSNSGLFGLQTYDIYDYNPEGEAWKVGLGYTFGNTTIGAIYENISVALDDARFDDGAGGLFEGDVDDAERDAWYLTAQHAFGNSVIKGYYGKAESMDDQCATNKTTGVDFDCRDNGDTSADLWAIGYDYNFSKRTTLYALYTALYNDGDGKVSKGADPDTVGSVNRPRTIDANYRANAGQAVSDPYSNQGDDVQVFSIGVIHKF